MEVATLGFDDISLKGVEVGKTANPSLCELPPKVKPKARNRSFDFRVFAYMSIVIAVVKETDRGIATAYHNLKYIILN